MIGASLDAGDRAVPETGVEVGSAFGPAGERKLSQATRSIVEPARAAEFIGQKRQR